MPEEFNKEKWLERLFQRIALLKEQKEPIIVKMNDEDLFMFDLGQRIGVYEKGIEIEVGPTHLKMKRGLVGLAGFYYNPKFFGGSSVKNVFSSWNWFFDKVGVDPEAFANAIEPSAVFRFLVSQIDEGLLYYLLALIVDLYGLDSEDVNVDEKISEIGKQLRSYIRKCERLIEKEPIRALLKADDLRAYLVDVSSESALARFAKLCGFDVKLGKSPDLTINGKAFEVKRLRRPLFSPRPASLSNPITRGLKQRADVVAIEVNYLEKRNIKGYKATWLSRNDLKSVLENALSFKENGKCILLFVGTNQGYFGRLILIRKAKKRSVRAKKAIR